jgi:hypothetical protein
VGPLAPLIAFIVGAGAPEGGDWIDWRAPNACPDEARVKEATAARLGRMPEPSEIEVSAVVIERESSGLELTLRTVRHGLHDARTLTSSTCEALMDATALVVAVAVDPMSAAASIEPAPSTIVTPPTLAPLPDAASSRPVPTAPAVDTAVPDVDLRPTDVTLAAGGGLEIGALPGPSGGPRLGFALGWSRVRVEIAGWYAAPRTAVASDGRVRVQMGAANGNVCGRLRARRLEAPICVGLELGANRGDGEDVRAPKTGHGLWIAPVVGVGLLGWVTPHVALGGRVEVAIPAKRTGFDIREPGDPIELWTPAPLSVRLWAGIEVRLWGRGDGSGSGRRDTR